MENISESAFVTANVVEASTNTEEEETPAVDRKNAHAIADAAAATPVPVLMERNAENSAQERRATPANPVVPVLVPPKKFLGFHAERYMSPTDSIMSPISRGLLARSQRSMRPPPDLVPSKALDHTFQNAELA